MPTLENTILFLEEDNLTKEVTLAEFDRILQSLIYQKGFNKIKGIVIGRFQKDSKVKIDFLKAVIQTKSELKNLPVIVNADFGHTTPQITFPIGGSAKLIVTNQIIELAIMKH